MNPETSEPTVADDQPVTEVARRFGPPVAIGSIVLTVALLLWLAAAPTAVAGPLTEAPFTVPATLVVGPDDDGCMRVVAGDGEATTHCLDELAVDDEDFLYAEAAFDDAGDVWIQREGEESTVVLTMDPATGEVLEREEFDRATGPPIGEDPVAERPVPVPDPGQPAVQQPEVYTDGDVVRRFGDDGPGQSEDDPVVLDLEGPPGYDLRDAVLSPDGAWVVVTTPRDDVVVAPTDGSAAPYTWGEVPEDRWVNLQGAIRWDG